MKRGKQIALLAPLMGAFLLAACKGDRATGPRSLPPRPSFTVASDAYIVVLRDATGDPAALSRAHGVTPSRVYRHALRGFAAQMNDAQVAALERNPNVDYIERDGVAQIVDVQSPTPAWGVDRIDQREIPLSASYTYSPTGGAGAHLYVVDTGVESGHQEFTGRATWDARFVYQDGPWEDCNGHGTHVGATAAGATVGVARGVRVHAIRVLDCSGTGPWSTIIAGFDWVAENGVLPAVVNISLGGSFQQSVNDAVQRLIDRGFVVVVASANSSADACLFSPASLPDAITVNASNINDAQAWFSNFGTCTDLYAPGLDILSAYSGQQFMRACYDCYRVLSGTSMATPHVSGAVALILGENPGMTVAEVTARIKSDATAGILTGVPSNTPNLLLFVGSAPQPPPPPPADDASFTVACTDLTCQFTAVTTGAWTFGDGGSGSGLVVTHTYTARTHYTVTHTVGATAFSRVVNCKPKRGCR